jgi:hypothetical protein
MVERDWRARVAEVPAWVAVLASNAALIGITWAVGTDDGGYFPAPALVACLILWGPVLVRVGHVGWFRTAGFFAAFAVTMMVWSHIDSFFVWLVAVLTPMAVAAYLLIDRAYEGPQ